MQGVRLFTPLHPIHNPETWLAGIRFVTPHSIFHVKLDSWFKRRKKQSYLFLSLFLFLHISLFHVRACSRILKKYDSLFPLFNSISAYNEGFPTPTRMHVITVLYKRHKTNSTFIRVRSYTIDKKYARHRPVIKTVVINTAMPDFTIYVRS